MVSRARARPGIFEGVRPTRGPRARGRPSSLNSWPSGSWSAGILISPFSLGTSARKHTRVLPLRSRPKPKLTGMATNRPNLHPSAATSDGTHVLKANPSGRDPLISSQFEQEAAVVLVGLIALILRIYGHADVICYADYLRPT
jgi:hypothetical protein